MIVKPSEVTPLSTIRLTKLLAEAQVPAGVVNLVLGAGSVVGGALVASPDVDLVSLTGGIATGTQIMRTAAGTGTRVALELGGKNPNIVFADAAFDAAVDYALAAAFLHSGQVCSAGARLLVQDDLHDAFLAAVVDRASRIRLGNGLDERSEVGPSILAGAGGAVSSAGSRLIIGSRRSTTNLAAASALSTRRGSRGDLGVADPLPTGHQFSSPGRTRECVPRLSRCSTSPANRSGHDHRG